MVSNNKKVIAVIGGRLSVPLFDIKSVFDFASTIFKYGFNIDNEA